MKLANGTRVALGYPEEIPAIGTIVSYLRVNKGEYNYRVRLDRPNVLGSTMGYVPATGVLAPRPI